MTTAYVIKGRVTEDGKIVSDETVALPPGEVEVIVRPVSAESTKNGETVFQFLRRLPPGQRTKEDIDNQVREERDSWDNGR